MILSFGLCIISFSYVCGFLFANPRTAFKLMPLILYFGTFILPSILLLLANLINPSVYLFTQYITCWLPMTAFLHTSVAFINQHYRFGNLLNSVISEPYQGVLVFLGDFVVFTLLAAYLDGRYLAASKSPPGSIRTETHSEDGVLAELQRVRGAADPVKVMQLQKIYPNGFPAVKNVSFGVGTGRIFGLLGPNGAGKSTTIGVLTKELAKSGGDVLIEGADIETYQPQYGFCPQYNPLYERLTVRDHLRLLSRLRGWESEEAVDYYVAMMGLSEFQHRLAEQLSGGNKRKLSVAMALIANPGLQFFDEPSTGLDPVAKRYLWHILKSTKSSLNTSLLLTTHSMEEAENLCDSLGIVVNGSMQCHGSPLQLRSKYGQGYNVHISPCECFDQSSYWAFVNENFPGAQQVSSLYEDFIVRKQGFRLSAAFRLIQQKVREGLIADFSISQASLHQVFIAIAKQQV